MNQEDKTDALAEILWDYHLMHHKLKFADCILVLGSHDLRAADYGIELFRSGWAGFLIFSGGIVHNKPHMKIVWNETEAEVFAKHAISRGVPPESILIESKSKNTGDNFRLTAELLAQKGIHAKSFIVVQKPYMERRTYATGKVHWPDKELIIASPPTTFQLYVRGDVPKRQIISFLVGDLQRIKVYGETGFQIPQEIPEKVWDAFEQLVKLGYTDRLIKE